MSAEPQARSNARDLSRRKARALLVACPLRLSEPTLCLQKHDALVVVVVFHDGGAVEGRQGRVAADLKRVVGPSFRTRRATYRGEAGKVGKSGTVGCVLAAV